MQHGICLNYSKVTGERIGLPYFLRVRPEDANMIFSLPIYTSRGKLLDYDSTAHFIKITKAEKGITDNYVLSGDGSVSLVYQPYELASYAAGITYIYISGKYVDYFNRKNH